MDKTIKGILVLGIMFLHCSLVFGQYEPAAGMPGSSAIHKDSSIILGWADRCRVQSGYMDCMDQSLGYTGPNDSTLATGMADGTGVISLGDGGMATLEFPFPISNGPGYDFAVFENAFSDDFLELAFVEVSSNGIDFVRFPSVSLTDTGTQTGSFGLSNPEKIHNLAGKYRFFYGTPFDLDDLNPSVNLDLQRITHVRIVDVVGCIQCESFTQYDSQGHIINDPYPTPFPQGGFDLDAVGVIHFAPAGLPYAVKENRVSIYPNPQISGQGIRVESGHEEGFEELLIINQQGRIIFQCSAESNEISLPEMAAGTYYLKAISKREKKISNGIISILPKP